MSKLYKFVDGTIVEQVTPEDADVDVDYDHNNPTRVSSVEWELVKFPDQNQYWVPRERLEEIPNV
jgi:hypothetical protein